MMQLNPFGFKRRDQIENLIQRIQKRPGFGQLRTDMAIDADHADMGHGRRAAIFSQSLLYVDAELVFL